MVVFQHRAWKLLATYEMLIGSWPYQNKIKSYALRIFALFFIVTAMMTLWLRMLEELDTLMIVLENVTGLLLLTVMSLKFIMPIIYEKQRRNIYEQVVEHFNMIEDKDEIEALRRHSNEGLKFCFSYTAVVAVLWGIAYTLPFTNMLFNYITGKNKLEKKLPLYVDYVILDEQQYFYFILIHMLLYTLVCIAADFAFDLSFIIVIRHVCALFEIVRIRLKKASDIMNELENSNDYEDKIKEANKFLSSAIIMHNDILRMIELIEEAYNISWLFILLINTVMVGTTLLACSFVLHSIFNVIKYTVAFPVFLIHFYVVFSQGQKIIDSSSSLFDACYNFSWYIAPKRSCTILSVIMSRSFKPSIITGGKGIFNLSMKTYSEMLRFGFTMFTVYNTLQQIKNADVLDLECSPHLMTS